MRDRTKYCRFYEDHGHIIEECRHFENETKRLIRERSLRKFFRKVRDERKTDLRYEIHVILMIMNP